MRKVSGDEEATLYAGEVPTDDIPSDSEDTLFAGSVVASPTEPDAEVFTPGAIEHATATAQVRRRLEPINPDTVPHPESAESTNSGVERTFHAMAAVELSTLFSHNFARTPFGISPRYKVRITQSDRQSTRGGALARQSILLYVEGNERQSIVIGFVESARNRAELRSYALMHELFKQRFRRPFDMVETEFERLSSEIRSFMDTQGLTVRTMEALPQPDGADAKPLHGESRGLQLRQGIMLLIGVLLIGVGLGYALAG